MEYKFIFIIAYTLLTLYILGVRYKSEEIDFREMVTSFLLELPILVGLLVLTFALPNILYVAVLFVVLIYNAVLTSIGVDENNTSIM